MKYLVHFYNQELDNTYNFFKTLEEAKNFIEEDFKENFEGGKLICVSTDREYLLFRSEIENFNNDTDYENSGMWDYSAVIVYIN